MIPRRARIYRLEPEFAVKNLNATPSSELSLKRKLTTKQLTAVGHIAGAEFIDSQLNGAQASDVLLRAGVRYQAVERRAGLTKVA